MELPDNLHHPEFSKYLISRDGRVYNTLLKRYGKIDINSCGYIRYYINGKKQFAHRLVAQTYIPNYNELRCVDHIDLNKQNNRVENLRWISHSGNSLNRAVNKNNKLKIKNITYSTRDARFYFVKQIQGKKHRKSFKSLDDAVNYKIEYHIKNNVILY